VPVLLIDGTRLLVTPEPGAGAVSVLPGSPHEGLIGLGQGGAAEEIPQDVLPFLGHGLDPALFSLGELEKAESGGRLPVRLTFTGSRPDLPGVTITSSGPGTADGYLTASGALASGAALARQSAADRAGGGQAGGLFGNGLGITLAGGAPAAAHPVSPDYQMHTLTVDVTNSAGRPGRRREVQRPGRDLLGHR
jgi:hypothetical protein